MDRPYATPDGVRQYLTSLRGLHALKEDRRAAAARYERLPAFCVLGQYVLAEDGGFGELTGGRSVKDLADVVPLEEFDRRGRLVHGERWGLSYKTPVPLAPYEGLCPGCGNGWTFHERSDVAELHDRRTVLVDDETDETVETLTVYSLHARCLEAYLAEEAMWLARDALDDAGFIAPSPEPCPPLEKGFGRWFRLATAAGTIRFGRRGPGYGIDWSDTGKDLKGIFCRIEGHTALLPVWNEPPVPNGPYHVDPRDETYLIIYLDRLRQALSL